MKRELRTFFKRIVPRPWLVGAWAHYSRRRSEHARQVFDAAPNRPEWLTRNDLERLQATYPLLKQSYRYDRASMARRARERVQELISLSTQEPAAMRRFLELGSSDGSVCYLLRQMGKEAVGVDYRIDRVNEQALAAGTMLAGMDAGQLGFADESFDYVFSYNSFEHFREPDVVLGEALRVVRPGGNVFLSFGPLWLSPRGAHQYKSITVPYCECLFPSTMLEAFAADKGLRFVDFGEMNQWSLTQYRDLWPRYAEALKVVVNYETFNADHVDLIEQYPSCFKSKTPHFEDLIVSNIDILFEKTRHT
ncbi:MAG: methyltransferase domain-containing protein [Candidatus Promineifilaceae bacterium]